MAANKVYIQVDFQASNAQQQIDELNKRIGAIGKTSQESTKQAGTAITGFSLTVDQATESVGRLAAQLSGLGLAAVTAEFIKLGEQILRTQFALENAFGAGTTSKMIEQVRALAVVAGVSTSAMIKYASDLALVYKVPQSQVAAWLKIFVDFNATLDGNAERVERMIEVFGRAFGRGQITLREASRALVQLGIPAGKILQEAYHVNATELKALLHGEQKDVEASIDVILRALEKGSKGAAERLAAIDPAAQYHRALNELSEAAQKLFVQLAPALVEITKFFTGLILVVEELIRAFKALPQWVLDVATVLGELVVAIVAYNTAAKVCAWVTGGLKVAYATAAGVIAVFTTAQELAAAATAQAALALGIEEGELLAMVAAITGVVYIIATIAWPELGQKIVKGLGAAWEWVTAKASEAYAAAKKIIGLIEPLKPATGEPLSYDTEGFKRALEASLNAVDEARARQQKAGREGIAAAVTQYQEEARKVMELRVSRQDQEKVLANYRVKLALDTTTEIIRLEEEAKQKTDKMYEETLRLRRQTMIAAAERMPDETFAGRTRVAQVRQAAYEMQLADEQTLEAKRIDERIDKEKAGAKESARIRGLSQVETDALLHRLDLVASMEKMQLADKTNEAMRKHTLDSAKVTNELRIAQEKQLREEMLQDDLAMIERRAMLEKAYLQAQRPATLKAHLDTIEQVGAIEQRAIKETYDRQITASNEALRVFEEDHAEYAKSVVEERERTAREQVRLQRDADTAMQASRLETWKATDAAILEEQKSLFDSMKSFWEGFWDAITDRSKSIWASMGDFFKKTILGALRDITTSRLAGAFMGMFGYGQPSFPEQLHPSRPYFAPMNAMPEAQTINATNSIFVAAQSLNGAGGALISSAAGLTAAAQALVAAAGVQAGGATVSSIGEASRTIDEAGGAVSMAGSVISAAGAQSSAAAGMLPFSGGAGPYVPPMFTGGAALPGFAPGMRGSLGLGGTASANRGLSGMLGSFGIGGPISINGPGSVTTIPWSTATAAQKAHAIAGSTGFASLLMGGGAMMAMGGLQRGGMFGNLQTIGGASMAGIGAASMFPALGLSAVGGAALGAGIGLLAAGLQRGGKLGLGMSVGGGALTGAVIGTMIMPGIGTAVGAAIGAAAGAIAGVIRLLNPGLDQRIRSEVKRVYGVDIAQKSIRDTIAQITTSKYGGNLSLSLYSQDVQDIVRLYSLNTGQSPSGLPRPMYSATFSQAQNGGLQLQPVYSGGSLINGPYTGVTTTQQQTALTNSGVYVQLNPQQANDLFSGRVVQVIQANPGAVAEANTTASITGVSRSSQGAALLEPLTVMR